MPWPDGEPTNILLTLLHWKYNGTNAIEFLSSFILRPNDIYFIFDIVLVPDRLLSFDGLHVNETK